MPQSYENKLSLESANWNKCIILTGNNDNYIYAPSWLCIFVMLINCVFIIYLWHNILDISSNGCNVFYLHTSSRCGYQITLCPNWYQTLRPIPSWPGVSVTCYTEHHSWPSGNKARTSNLISSSWLFLIYKNRRASVHKIYLKHRKACTCPPNSTPYVIYHNYLKITRCVYLEHFQHV